MKILMESWRKFLEGEEKTETAPEVPINIVIPDWLRTKLENVHTQPGQGSVFKPSIDEVEKIIKNILSKRTDIEEVATTTGTIETTVPSIGYNLVLPTKEALKLPDRELSYTEKREGRDSIEVPKVTTSAPMEDFISDNLTIIVRPMKDESGDIKPNEFIVLSAYPGEPNIPRASEWNGRYAVIVPKR